MNMAESSPHKGVAGFTRTGGGWCGHHSLSSSLVSRNWVEIKRPKGSAVPSASRRRVMDFWSISRGWAKNQGGVPRQSAEVLSPKPWPSSGVVHVRFREGWSVGIRSGLASSFPSNTTSTSHFAANAKGKSKMIYWVFIS